MSDIKNFLDIVEEFSDEEGLVEAQDSFDIELGEDLIIETGVIDINEDGILVEGDEETLRLLAEHGLILEETDWSKYDEPTINRIKKGVTKPVDRTDYDTPPAMRDPMQGKPGYEKRKSRIMKGLEKVDEKMVMGLPGDQGSKVMGEGTPPAGYGDYSKGATNPDGTASSQRQADREFDRREYEEEQRKRHIAAMRSAGLDKDGNVLPLRLDKDGKRLEEEDEIEEAKYQGREVPLGKPMAGDVKKSKVYVKGPKGNVVKVNFGDKKMRIKKSNPSRRKSFRARHNCKNPGPRWKARYWSCRAW